MKISLLKRIEIWLDQALCAHEVITYKSKTNTETKVIKTYECMECKQQIKVERER
jgi:hypothetical protein